MPTDERPAWRRFLTSSGWLVAGLLLGALFAVPLVQATDWVSWHWRARSVTGSPTCADPGWYRPISQVDASAYQEHRENNDPTVIYTAGNTTDGDQRTAWVARTGVEQQNWIRFDLARNRHLTLICVRPGFRRDDETLANNGRPKDIRVSWCGDEPAERRLGDSVDTARRGLVRGSSYRDWVGIRVDCDTDEVRLTVRSTYPAVDGSDLFAISDVRFYGGFSISQQ